MKDLTEVMSISDKLHEVNDVVQYNYRKLESIKRDLARVSGQYVIDSGILHKSIWHIEHIGLDRQKNINAYLSNQRPAGLIELLGIMGAWDLYELELIVTDNVLVKLSFTYGRDKMYFSDFNAMRVAMEKLGIIVNITDKYRDSVEELRRKYIDYHNLVLDLDGGGSNA